jgi:peptide/nickel transport system permease protein
MADRTRSDFLRPRIVWFLSLRRRGAGGKMVVLGAGIIGALVLMTLIAPLVAPHDPFQGVVSCGLGQPCAVPPNARELMGTNQLGQDIFSRILFGGATMMEVAILSVILCLCVGVPLGLFAGYISGAGDRLLSLGMDSLYAFPGLVLAIAIASVLGTGVVNLAVAIAVVYIPSYFRVVRSQTLSLKQYPFVEAVKVAGARTAHVLFRQILPNVVPSIVVIASVNVADAVLTEAGLTYLGLGPNVALPDWGWDIYYGKTLFLSGAWWAWAFPGLMIVLLVAGFSFIGEGLSEIWNPRLRRGSS